MVGVGAAIMIVGVANLFQRHPIALQELAHERRRRAQERVQRALEQRAAQLEAEVTELKAEAAKKTELARTYQSIDETIDQVRKELLARIKAGETAQEHALRVVEHNLEQTRSELEEFDAKASNTKTKRVERPKSPEKRAVKIAAETGTETLKFSKQLGIQHAALVGKKFLLEFDPSTPYERAVRDLVEECVRSREAVVVMTPNGSALQQALEGQKGVEIVNLTPDTMLSAILEKHPERPLSLVYDSLSDLALSADSRTAYRFAFDSLRLLSDARISAVFLLNPSAHESTDVNSLRGLFRNQLVYDEQGMRSVKLG
jgi:hypothetical protein